jgi:hypothetical protein
MTHGRVRRSATHIRFLLCYWFSTPNCLAYSAFNQPLPAAELHRVATSMRPMRVPLRRRSRTPKQMCQPAVPQEMKRRSMLCDSVRRVPPSNPSRSHRISSYSSTSGTSARATVVTCGLPVPTQVIHLGSDRNQVPVGYEGHPLEQMSRVGERLPDFSGKWRSSLTRMSLHFSLPFCTSGRWRAPACTARDRSSSSPCSALRWCGSIQGQGCVCELPRERTRTGGGAPNVRNSCIYQFCELNEVTADVVQLRNGRAGHLDGQHRKLGVTLPR